MEVTFANQGKLSGCTDFSGGNVNTIGIRLATAALLLTICCACRTDLFNTRAWTFEGVSTASKPPKPYTIFSLEGQYSIVKIFNNPNGWRADTTWSAPRNPSEILSVEEEDNLPFKFTGAYFTFMKSADDQRKNFPWSRVIEQAQEENGPWTGRSSASGSSEYVYWGRVSIGQGDIFHCATNCLVLIHWGAESDQYSVHLDGRMPPAQAWQNPVP